MKMSRAVIQTILVVALSLPALARAQQPPAKQRLYTDGPLAAADFKMAPPKPLPLVAAGGGAVTLLATTYAEIRFDFKYRWRADATGKATATATEVTFVAVLIQDKSWNARPKEASLMDHEQGHFDIAELHAWRAQKRIGKMTAEGAFQGVGTGEADARDKMQVVLNKDFDRHLVDMKDEQAAYDKDTRHGTDREKQSQWRKKLNEQLESAAAERRAAARKAKAAG